MGNAEQHTLARLEADRNECETLLVRLEAQHRLAGPPSDIDRAIYDWLKQHFDDLTVQMQEMQRHTDESAEAAPTSPAAYRRWVNRNQLEDS